MKLYYMPGACSLASNIALREAGVPFELVKVDRKTRTAGGRDYLTINGKGYVPALQLDSGEVLTENIALLSYIADRNPAAKLAPPAGSMERYRLLEWLAFISTEIHKSFTPFFKPDTTDAARESARANLTLRLGWADQALGDKPCLMGGQYTVADSYLFTILGWAVHVKYDLAPFPHLQGLQGRVASRPHTQAALKAEGLLK
ncbi:MAG: glutathione transferase GstA [Proteobacteria bacterium]|nr:glutathione transferase GstA [Pseudomonadota bacterium]